MNCKQAKNISIIEFLTKEGYSYSHIKNNCVWYCSPLRNEKEPSFKIDIGKNTFKDFGTGVSGNVIDLAMLIFKTDIHGALNHLSGLEIKHPDFFSFQQQEVFINDGIKINHTQPLQNKALIQYCTLRKIPYAIAKEYLIEAYYQVNEKKYFSVAFKSDNGGYELRNIFFKNCTSPKYITTIQGANKRVLTLFEGFFDFLTAFVYYEITTPNNDTIILNSLSFLDIAIEQTKQYAKINLFFDNDEAGKHAARLIKKNHKNVVDYSQNIYPNNKDFNEFLQQKKSTE